MEGVMSLKEAAAALGVKADTLRQQILAGRLTATKLGRDWLVPQVEIERYRMEHLDKRGYSKRRQAAESGQR